MGNLRSAAPVFIAVVLGIYLLAAGLAFEIVVAALAILYFAGWAFQAAATSRLAQSPVLAVRIWQGAVLTPVAVIAATTYLTTYVAFEATGWLLQLPDSMIDRDWLTSKASDLGKTLVGALNTLVAALWLDNAKQPTGKLWPSGQVKAAFEKTFRPRIIELRDRPKPDRPHYELERAVAEDQTTTISGWDHSALLSRAAVIEKFLRDVPEP